jgi:hypothetical protein
MRIRKWKSYHISRNGLSPKTNRFIGKFTYFLLHSLIFIIGYKIWGFQMFDEVWFYLMHSLAFVSAKIILLALGIWVY